MARGIAKSSMVRHDKDDHARRQSQRIENDNLTHSQFLSEASAGAEWGDGRNPELKSDKHDATRFGEEALPENGAGKLSSTSSHLFKLILPLWRLNPGFPKKPNGESDSQSSSQDTEEPPVVILLHPSQPLSHVARLVESSLPEPLPTRIAFHSPAGNGSQVHHWSDSTDVGDFVKEASKAAKFTIQFEWAAQNASGQRAKPQHKANLDIQVPTFADRTKFLRKRLDQVNDEMSRMEVMKKICDVEAHKGARKMAVTGLGMLVLYWATVARLTFWDLGWDIMEPVTYLSGLSTVICGYLWFLYQGREVSYTSVLDKSISSRRQAQYVARGFDIERWVDLKSERKGLRAQIKSIARDYDRENESATQDDETDSVNKKESPDDDAHRPSHKKLSVSLKEDERDLEVVKEMKAQEQKEK